MSIYLDHNATTPMLPEVAEAMSQCWRAGPLNPSSQHSFGRRARQVIDSARETIGRLLGAEVDRFDCDKVVFTSGGTEANHLALAGLMGDPPGHVIVSTIEHPSLLGAADQLRQRGFDVSYLPVDNRGVVDVARLDELLQPNTRLVSVMLGNNETGVLQPVAEIVERCTRANVPVHTDAVQVAGKLPIDFRALGVAAMTVTAHKLHGPVGVGALVVRGGQNIKPLWVGGFQQGALRPGTEGVALTVGFRTALELWDRDHLARSQRLETLRDRFESRLIAKCPQVVINGRDAPRLPHTSNVAFPGLDRQALVMALDLAGVACSTGSACASGSSEPSHVLTAMKLPRAIIEGSLRVSLGVTTTEVEIDAAVETITRVIQGPAFQRA